VEEILDLILHLTRTRPQWGMTPVRIVFGILLFLHSLDILRGSTLEGRLTFFSLRGWSLRVGKIVTIIMLIFGVMMIPGFLSRIVGLFVIILSIASGTIQWTKFGEVLNLRFKMTMAAIAILFVLSGSGRYSLDWMISSRIEESYPDEKVHAYIHAETELKDTPWWW